MQNQHAADDGEQQVQDVFLTLWGDNGGECSPFALLPALYYASEYAKGNRRLPDIKKSFREKYGISFDTFMQLDLPGGGLAPDYKLDPDFIADIEKYMLYNDPFMGIFDSTVQPGGAESFRELSKKLSKAVNDPEWGYLFDSERALCDVLAIKYDLGVRTREAYQKHDTNALISLLPEYSLLSERLEIFYRKYGEAWKREKKPQGFDVQEIRLGGLMLRVRSCCERLKAYTEGTLNIIEELEEPALDLYGGGTELKKEPCCSNHWASTVTCNSL